MNGHLKQNTGITISMGPFLDTSGSAKTALTIPPSSVLLSKNGGTLTAKADAATATADTAGYYKIDLTASDVNTLGILRMVISPSGVLPIRQDYMIMPMNVWDSFYSTDKLDVNAVEIGSSSSAASNVVSNIPNLDTAVSTRSTLDASGVWAFATRLITDLTGSALTAISNIQSDTNDLQTQIGVAGAGLTAIPNLDIAVSTRSTLDASGVWTYATRLITDFTGSALTTISNIPSLVWTNTARMITDMTGSAKTAVNAEMLDALATDTYTEPASVPAATTNLANKINWLYTLSRNKIIVNSDTGHSLRNDADGANISTAGHSDISATGSGTYTRNEWA